MERGDENDLLIFEFDHNTRRGVIDGHGGTRGGSGESGLLDLGHRMS